MASKVLILIHLLIIVSYTKLSRSDEITAPMEKTEHLALVTAIRGFVGDSWDGAGLYPDPCGWTPIQGVSCDLINDTWHVTALNIGPVLDNSLKCSRNAKFNSKLFELNHLRTLSIFNCFTLTSTNTTLLPIEGWENLSLSLQTLEFRSNQGLIGSLPPTIGFLRNLKSLVLVSNGLTGELPKEIGNLVKLKRLSLARNRFYGPIPGSIGNNLSDLLILDLNMNNLTGLIPPSIGNMGSLLKLDLSSNHLAGEIPTELGKLKSLSLLDLRNNNLTGRWARSIRGLVSLQYLLLSNNPMGGNLMEIQWQDLCNLTYIQLSNMNLTGEIPESLAELKRLRFLSLNNNYLYGLVSPKLESLPFVNGIYINGNNLTGELGFSQGFYERMGRRFASWDNPNLCYTTVGLKTKETAPLGVKKCGQ